MVNPTFTLLTELEVVAEKQFGEGKTNFDISKAARN